ncbi:MAG: tyrosine--tRNA ligase [Planctomycetes bacterium]|nr:tyrosine--tRNA ligase [Planctomycetota bacterium]
MTISEQLERLKRGAVEIFNLDELAQKLRAAAKEGRQLRIKLGLDPTSPDIHLGHTVVLHKLRQFQDLGHKAVLIIGDYTAQIGDPTGQNKTRPMLNAEEIRANAESYCEQAGKVLDRSEERFEVRYNSEWLADMTLLEMIQLAAKKTVAQMLKRDSFKNRLQANVDVYVHEFLYPLLQGYDSYAIKADVELGGTDQTFNNLVGRDVQKAYGQGQQVVMTMPILAGLDGVEKMSKSKNNTIGVTDRPDDMFGKVMSISDEMMEDYFTLLTETPVEQIKVLVDPTQTHPKAAKVLLGKAIVAQFHHDAAACAAADHFDKVFRQKEVPAEIAVVVIGDEALMASKLLMECKLVASGGEGKRMIRQGGASIDGQKLTDPKAMVSPRDGAVVKVGKRKFAKLSVRKS